MDVLSAESYNEPTATGSKANDLCDTHLPCGLILESSPDPTPIRRQSSRAKQVQRKLSDRNASRSVSADVRTGTRQRGRPRLDARDQTAGERRRTQIRLAQRAYRQRKETTISKLNERVTNLERVIGEMDQRLSSFQERAFASGIENSSPVLAQDLRAVAACFNDLARYRVPVSKSDDRSPSSDLSTGIYSMEDSAQSRETVQALAARNQSGSGSKPNFESSQFWGYEVYREDMQAEQGEAPNVQCDTDYYGPVDVSIDLDLITQNTTELYRADVSEMGPETQTMFPLFGKALAPPSTYSFQESTFARRLCRAAYERAHRMLTDPSSRKEEIHAIFKFSFCFTDIPGILGFVGGINGKGKEESLETWEAPQLHLGNAGLHYPRQTEAHIPSNWADKAPMGPKRSANAETPVPDWMTIDQIIEMTGFQGEWFDPHDVEHYLVSKGLQLDGESTWLELDVNAVPGLERTQLNAIASPAESYPDIDPSSPANVGSQTANEPVVHAAETSWNVEMAKIPDTPYMDLNPRFTEPFTNTKTGIANLAYDAASMFSSALAKGHTTAKKMVNIEKFIDIVVHQGVCLGRTPGWRRSTIDSALTNSIQEVFQHDLIGTS